MGLGSVFWDVDEADGTAEALGARGTFSGFDD